MIFFCFKYICYRSALLQDEFRHEEGNTKLLRCSFFCQGAAGWQMGRSHSLPLCFLGDRGRSIKKQIKYMYLVL